MSSSETAPETTIAELLWQDLSDLFVEEGDWASFHAGPDVEFNDLSPEGVERLWEYLRARADPIEPTVEIWHDERNQSVPLVDVPDAVALVQQEKIATFTVYLRGIRSGGVPLPDIGVWVHPSAFAIYWWVGGEPDWTIESLCGFAELIGDLRDLEPASRLGFEWGEPREFFDPIDRYLHATRRGGTSSSYTWHNAPGA